MSCGRGVMKGLKDVTSEVWIVVEKNFVYLNRICRHEEVVREQNVGFVGIHPLVKVFPS